MWVLSVFTKKLMNTTMIKTQTEYLLVLGSIDVDVIQKTSNSAPYRESQEKMFKRRLIHESFSLIHYNEPSVKIHEFVNCSGAVCLQ